MDWMLIVNLAQLAALIIAALLFINRQTYGMGQLVQEFRALTTSFGAHRKDFLAHKNENEQAHADLRSSVSKIGEKVARVEGRLDA